MTLLNEGDVKRVKGDLLAIAADSPIRYDLRYTVPIGVDCLSCRELRGAHLAMFCVDHHREAIQGWSQCLEDSKVFQSLPDHLRTTILNLRHAAYSGVRKQELARRTVRETWND